MRRLVIRPGAIGDCILSLPAIELLRSRYLEVWVAAPNVPLVRFADRVRAISSTGLDLFGIPGIPPCPELLDTLSNFDSIVSWYGANRPEFREHTSEIGLRFRFLAALPDHKVRAHASDFFVQQVAAMAGLTEPLPAAIPRIPCPSREGGFAALHPFSGSAKKNWPLDRYLELGIRLAKRLPVKWCVRPGDPFEAPAGQEIIRTPDLYELTCRLASASIYIGNDSGITHLAAAAGTRVVALFGPTDPAVWAPRGPLVRVVVDGSGEGISAVTVDSVAESCLELLALNAL